MQHRYTLRPRWGTLILATVFFGGCGAVMWYEAMHDRRGVVIEGVIHLDPGQARIFYVVLMALCFGFIAMGALAMLRLSRGGLCVEIDDDGITLPGSPMRPRPRRFAWASISSARLSKVSGQVFMTITGPAGKATLARIHLA
ncbi:MAG TPA: hypothetical protein VK601_00680, partial [Kofleriaceae bacterium]|nr:hypothetical protein [Kofleriaceae bacterium]